MTPEQIKDWRVKKGWTQERLARAVGVSVNTVARWERGERTPDRGSRIALHAAMTGGGDALDLELHRAYARANDAGRAAMDAVAHAEANDLSPLALALAGSATIAAAHGETSAEWVMRCSDNVSRDKLESAVSELIAHGLWPWR